MKEISPKDIEILRKEGLKKHNKEFTKAMIKLAYKSLSRIVYNDFDKKSVRIVAKQYHEYIEGFNSCDDFDFNQDIIYRLQTSFRFLSKMNLLMSREELSLYALCEMNFLREVCPDIVKYFKDKR